MKNDINQVQFTKGDLMQALLAVIIGLCILIPISISPIHQLNEWIQLAIPPIIGFIFIVLPLWMLMAIDRGERRKHQQLQQAKRRFQYKKARKRLYLRVDQKKNPKGGTVWEVSNRNCFDWNNVHLVIRNKKNGEELSQVHRFGKIGRNQKISFLSEFSPSKEGQFEYFLVCEEGKHKDFPSSRKEFNPEAIEKVFAIKKKAA